MGKKLSRAGPDVAPVPEDSARVGGGVDPRERARGTYPRRKSGEIPVDLEALPPESVKQALHELRSHQRALELQNEELRRTQEQLEAARARYFALYDLAPVAYFTVAEGGLVVEANRTASTLLGLPRGAPVRLPLTRFILPDDQDIYFRHRKHVLATGVVQTCELRMLRADGNPFWAQLKATTAVDADGAPVVRALVSDVTEHKHAQDTLHASEARHRILFQKSPDALTTVAPPSWKFTAGNASALAMFGTPDEAEFLQRAPWDYSPELQPDGRPSAEKAVAMLEVAMADGSHSFEWTHRRASGEPFQATILLTRMDVDGQPLIQALVRDDTAAQRQKAMMGQTDRLASMGLLAAGVAHEINNPLAYVLFNVDTLAQDLPKIADTAERCVSALRAHVGEVEFAAIAGEDAEVLEPRMLKDAVDRAQDALTGTHRIRNISKVLGTFSRADEMERTKVDVHYAMECAITMVSNEYPLQSQARQRLRLHPRGVGVGREAVSGIPQSAHQCLPRHRRR